MRARRGLVVALVVSATAACTERRPPAPEAVVYDADVAPILERRCARCHDGDAPAAGWRATSYLGAIACVAPSGRAATLPASAQAPIVEVLARPSHAGVATEGERVVLEAWVGGGAPAFMGTVHEPGIVDPRSPAFHGAALRGKRWSPMLDANDPDACGRCHDGTPARPAGVTSSAPGATACTSCHDRPGGVLACGTCHGDGTRPFPPRDPCFFPDDRGGAHLAHVSPSTTLVDGLACTTCHPMPGDPVIGGLHGNGGVEIVFDPKRVKGEASFDAKSGSCAVDCHDAGGARPRPAWTETAPMRCGDCHGAPPAQHFPGACNRCHAEANADGTALVGGPLHLDGKVDLGDGSGGCGACHGEGTDPWPATGAHAAHRAPTLTTPVACAECHTVPAKVLAPGHLDGHVEIAFSGRALARSAMPRWEGGACSDVACHGARLPDDFAATPIWNDTSGQASTCGACHGVPPINHTASTDCGRSTCHSGETSPDLNGAPRITNAGRLKHIDGNLDVGP